jgi:hypothetical protein
MRNVLLACALVTWLIPPSVATSAEDDKTVRKLTVEVDPIASSQWSAKPGARAMSDQKEVTKLLGQSIAKQLAGKIDFSKEDLVHVAWGSSGPPFGTLEYEIKDGKDGKTITFSIKEPKVPMRGMAFRLGNDFFAVPKKSKVVFGPAR